MKRIGKAGMQKEPFQDALKILPKAGVRGFPGLDKSGASSSRKALSAESPRMNTAFVIDGVGTPSFKGFLTRPTARTLFVRRGRGSNQ